MTRPAPADKGIGMYVLGALLAATTLMGCLSVKVDQPIPIERVGKVAVIPFTAVAPLYDNEFSQRELAGNKEELSNQLHAMVVKRLSKELVVIPPKTIRDFIAEHGYERRDHFSRGESTFIARRCGADIAVCGLIRVIPHFDQTPVSTERRCDVEAEVKFIDVWNDDDIATVKISGTRKDILQDFSQFIQKLKFYPK